MRDYVIYGARVLVAFAGVGAIAVAAMIIIKTLGWLGGGFLVAAALIGIAFLPTSDEE